MADQIIIELIGDPSGLKPAEDGLKSLSKVSEENMQAFNKANDAANKFKDAATNASKAAKDLADKAGEANKAISSIAEAATKSITAISSLNGVIAAGAVKEVTKDYKGLSEETKALIETKQKLIIQLDAESAKLDTLRATNQKGTADYIAQKKVISELTVQTSNLSSTLEKHGLSLTQVSNNAFRAGAAQKLLGEDLKQSAAASADSVKANDTLTASATKAESVFKRLSNTIKDHGEKVKDHGQAMNDNLGHASSLTTALGEMGEAVAKAAGNEDAAAEIKKKTAAAIQMITFAQEAATVATEAATLASTALDTAMLPIIAIAAAIAVGIGAAYVAFQKFAFVREIVAGVGKVISKLSVGVKHLLNMFGKADTKALDTINEKTKETGQTVETANKSLEKKSEILETQSNTLTKITAQKKEQNQIDQQLIANQDKLAKGEKERQEQSKNGADSGDAKKEALDKEIQAVKDADTAELNAHISMNNAKLLSEKEFSEAAISIKKEILADQMQKDIDSATASISNEQERMAKITEIQAKYGQDVKQIDEDVARHKEELSKAETAKAADSAKKQEDVEKKLGAEAVKVAQQVSDAIFASSQQRRDNELKATEDSLNAQKNAELLNTTLTASQRNAIEKKYKAEEAQAKLQAWKADQKAKAEQAVINGLLAFAAAIAQDPTGGYINGAIALATAGVQAGIILSKTPPKFAKGTKGAATLPSGMKIVGEEGPEIIYTPGGEKVFTAADTEKILASYNVPTLPIPMLSTLPRLHDMNNLHSSLSAGGHSGAIDYDKLGRAVAGNIPSPVINSIQLNEKGFIKHITRHGNRTEYIDNEIKF